jgi:hypothetical protein
LQIDYRHRRALPRAGVFLLADVTWRWWDTPTIAGCEVISARAFALRRYYRELEARNREEFGDDELFKLYHASTGS